MAHATIDPIKSSSVRDTYKFGNGPEPVLQPGTMGWSAADLEDPQILRLWEQGRYEIIDGVLITMPAAYFRGGRCAFVLATLLRIYLRERGQRCEFAGEADIQLNQLRRVRADFACVIGDDLSRFAALKFIAEGTDWRDHALIIPPTLVIESVSKGHEAHDRETKRNWYAGFGVRLYWIVDAYAKSLECLSLKDGRYVDDGTGRGADTVTPSSMPGFIIPLTEVWKD